MKLPSYPLRTRRKAVWGPKRKVAILLAAGMLTAAPSAFAAASRLAPGVPNSAVKSYKLDDELTRRAQANPLQTSRVIVELVRGAQLPAEFKVYARPGKLDIINGQVLELPNGLLKRLADHSNVFRVHDDRPVGKHNYRTSVTVGAGVTRSYFGLTGAGVGVAVIDSGIATWHDDLTVGSSKTTYPYGDQRVSKFVDFVNGRTLPYDDNGHGTHVAGIIAGNGYDSKGEKTGIAPEASLISLKVLDATGQGRISNIISALNWIVQNGATYNIRVVNMSVGASVRESYWTDPLTLAAKAVAEKGIVIVTAAGNNGRNAAGQPQYGGISAPGNAPWVITVGASSTNGTLTRADDTLASFSSAGPTYLDHAAKPDVIAPGTGTISLAASGSLFATTKLDYLVSGSLLTATKPYLSLSGTSMAAPVVSGTLALMFQANPSLTPNLAKAILQYSSQRYSGYNALQQGAGFLNSLGAVILTKVFSSGYTGTLPDSVTATWSKEIIWGSHRIRGGMLRPSANAWRTDVLWGAAKTLITTGDNVAFGTMLGADNLSWGTSFDGGLWSVASDNVVWGTDCGGADCDNVVWGTVDPLDNVVWGTMDLLDNVVWGTSGCENVVWGTSDEHDNVVWGTESGESLIFSDTAGQEPLPDVQLELGEVFVPVVTPEGGI